MQKTLVLCLLLLVSSALSQSVPNVPELEARDEFALSAPRTNIAASSAKNYAILAGGFENDTASDVVDVLDVSTKNISQLTLSVPRYNILSASTGSYVVFAGGVEIIPGNETGLQVPSPLVEVLDLDSMQWRTTTQFPDSFYAQLYTVIASTDQLFVFSNGTNLAIFNPTISDDTAWIISEPFPTSGRVVIRSAIAVNGSTIYVPLSTSFLVYDVSDLSQPQQTVTVPDELDGFVRQSFVIGQKVYFIVTGFQDSNTNYVYDTQRYSWDITLVPNSDDDFDAVAIQGNIVGYDRSQLYIFVVDLGQWFTQTRTEDSIFVSGTAVADKYLVLAGGSDGSVTSEVIEVYEYVPPASAVPIATSTPNVRPVTSGTTFCAVSVLFLILCVVFAL